MILHLDGSSDCWALASCSASQNHAAEKGAGSPNVQLLMMVFQTLLDTPCQEVWTWTSTITVMSWLELTRATLLSSSEPDQSLTSSLGLVCINQSEASIFYFNQSEASISYFNQSEASISYFHQSEASISYLNQSEESVSSTFIFDLNFNDPISGQSL